MSTINMTYWHPQSYQIAQKVTKLKKKDKIEIAHFNRNDAQTSSYSIVHQTRLFKITKSIVNTHAFNH